MSLRYHCFDPSASGFPRPQVSPLPQLSFGSLRWTREAPIEILGTGRIQHFARARYALREAYRLAGLGPSSSLLAPAYHCLTMLDPAIRLGAEIELYPLDANLAPRLDRLEAVLATCRQPARALLLPHYFGIPQASLAAIRDFCDRRRIVLIEDCSHALTAAGEMGRVGRLAVSSPYKFFPVADGGCLWGQQLDPAAELRPAPWSAELKSVIESLRQIARPTPTPAPLHAAGPAGADRCVDSPGISGEYRPADELLQSLRWSRRLTGRIDLKRLVARRRSHYMSWRNGLKDLSSKCRALVPELPVEVAPYMFPLLVEQPEDDFDALKRQGLPIWRWDKMASSSCEVSASYRLGLWHLPCHQEISDAQLGWMIETVRKVFAKAASPKVTS
jgi:hypothetical protein